MIQTNTMAGFLKDGRRSEIKEAMETKTEEKEIQDLITKQSN